MKAKTKLTRLCGILLTLVLLVGLLPTTALAADATADFTTDPTAALALLNTAKTGAADSTWDPTSSTLTLNGVNFVTTAATAVKLPADTTIVLADGTTNTITSTYSGPANSYGIYVDNGNLTIQGETAGTGKLIVNGGTATGEDKDSYGIRANQGDVTISGGTVEVTGGAASHKSSGIYARRDEDGSGGYIGGNINISGGAEVTAAGGDVTDATSLSYGLFANEAMTISDSAKVTATGGASRKKSYGIRVYRGDVTISDGAQVIATGGTAGNNSCGIYSDNGNVEISGGAVKAKAGSATSAAALNKAPTLTITAYSWRTSDSNDYSEFPGSAYTYVTGQTYVEIKSNPTISITSVAITGIDAPVSNTALDTTAACATTGVSTTAPTVTWTPNAAKADYGATYTASVTLTATDGYAFADDAAVTVNDNPANVTKNTDGTLTVTYTFPATAKHNIEITVDTDVRGGDAAKNPTINSGYEFAFCVFPEDTNGDGDFTKDLTLVIDKDLLEEFAEQKEMTLDEVIAALAGEGLTVKTEFTGGYDYCVYAKIQHSDRAAFTKDPETEKATNAIVKVNGKEITDSCQVLYQVLYQVLDTSIVINPGSYVFTAQEKTLSGLSITKQPAKTTYTVGESFDTAGMVVKATYSNGSTAAVTSYTVSPSGALTTSDTSVTISYTEGDVTRTATQVITVNPAAPTGGGIYIPPTYKVESTVSEDADGTVTFSKASAKKGDTVTITVTPDRYYKVDGVTVKDALGNQIAVTDNGNGTFTFKMPDSKVTVEPVFSWDNPFVDVAGDAYYAPAVEWALKNEVTDGTSDTTFSPDAGCTRAQIVTFLWRAAGCPEPVGMSSFTDVSADAYYAKAVAWAAEQGITGGTGDGKFSPDAVCTRGQIVTFLWRAEKSPAVGTANPFTDVEADAYYAGATNWAVENGITEGTGDGTTFSPANDCTRAQIVTFLYRYFVK